MLWGWLQVSAAAEPRELFANEGVSFLGALVEDTIYLDGGYMSWIVGSGSQQREEGKADPLAH